MTDIVVTTFPHHVFGSEDSRDCDIVAFVDSVPSSVAENKALISKIETAVQPLYHKMVNVNIASISDGVVSDVFKGTPDEVNNSIFYTYALHQQSYPLLIKRAVPREPGIKNLRAMRSILSLMSRTQYRVPIKDALRGTAAQKSRLLNLIEIQHITDLGHKNVDFADFYKAVAFQIGQSYLLNIGIEVYTKSAVAQHITALKPALDRSTFDPAILDGCKRTWLASFDPTTIPQHETLRS